MEIQIENKKKRELFFKLFPVLFGASLGSFDSFVVKINAEGLFIKQKDLGCTTQLDVEYSKNAFDFISDEEVYIKFNGNQIKKILETAKQTSSNDSSIILKFIDPKNPFLQVLATQKYEIRLEVINEEDKIDSILPYTVEKYADISDLKSCSKLISTLSSILTNNTSIVGLELRKNLLLIHAKDEDGIKHAHHEIKSVTNTETIQNVNVSFYHLDYITKLIDSGAEGLRLYIQTDRNLIFEVTFPFEIKITIYAACPNIS